MPQFAKLKNGTLINLDQVVQLTSNGYLQLTAGNVVSLERSDHMDLVLALDHYQAQLNASAAAQRVSHASADDQKVIQPKKAQPTEKAQITEEEQPPAPVPEKEPAEAGSSDAGKDVISFFSDRQDLSPLQAYQEAKTEDVQKTDEQSETHSLIT